MGDASTANPLLDGLAWTVVHSAWQGLLVALIYRLGRAVVGDASRRYLLGMSCLFIFLLLQVTTLLCWFRWNDGDGISLPFVLSTQALYPPVSPPEIGLLGQRMPVELPERSWLLGIARHVSPAISWLGWFWLGGVALCTLAFVTAMHLLRREIAQCTPLDEQTSKGLRNLAAKLRLTKEVQFVETRESSVPATCGWLQPVVLLPVKENLNLGGSHLEALVLHELAHIVRRDFLTHQLRRLIHLLYFFHPLIRSIDHQMTGDSEEAADEIAARALGNPTAYAAALLSLEESRMGALKLGAAGGSLKRRLWHVVALRNTRYRKPSRLTMLLTFLCAILMVMACSELIVRAASPDQRLLAAMETRNLPEMVLASLNIPTTRDRASSSIQRAVTEFESSGTVSIATLEEMSDAIHAGMPSDLVINHWRNLDLVEPSRSNRKLPIGSHADRVAVAARLTALARETADAQRQARFSRAACALLCTDIAVNSAAEARAWMGVEQNVSMMHLDPRTQRDIDFAFAFHSRRVGAAKPLANRFSAIDDTVARPALEAAAYETCSLLQFSASATATDWDRLRGLLPELSDDAERRWRLMYPRQLRPER